MRATCWLKVTTDAEGIVRLVDPAPGARGQMAADPVFNSFVERAKRALLSPQCENLPLPKALLGQTRTFDFNFRP